MVYDARRNSKARAAHAIRREVRHEMRGRGGRPRGGTRELILNVALQLFTEQGYDKTSLREIAEELGVTKAALYYHFAKKEDLLLALHLRLHELGFGVLERLSDDTNLEVWEDLLDEFIEKVAENRQLFLLHARNQNAFEKIEHGGNAHDAAHQDMEQRLRRVLANPMIPIATRVRMACSIGAVMGALMEGGEAFGDVEPDELATLVREAVHDLLAPAHSRGARGRGRSRNGSTPRRRAH